MITYNTTNLSALEIGRLRKCLAKMWRFREGEMSINALINLRQPQNKKISNNMANFNKTKYNRMTSETEQNAYIDNLKKTKAYLLGYHDNEVGECFFDVPKLVYDTINLPGLSEDELQGIL